MFKGLGNLGQLGSLLKQAQQMGGRLQKVNEELKNRRATGAAGGGMVTVEVTGAGDVLSCRIDPSLVTAGDRELLEDLVPAAVNQALAKAKEMHAEAMRSVTSDLDLPPLDDVLEQLKAAGGEPPAGPPAN